MNHGRSIAAACVLAALLAPRARADSPFKITFALPDHPCGLYHVKDDAKIEVTVANTSSDPLEFTGDIAFGPLVNGADIKPLSATPVQQVTIAPGQRVKIPLSLTFGAAGPYQLTWRHEKAETPIVGEQPGIALHCIFAPRAAKPEESPWLAVLPAAAVNVPGFLTDYVRQTTVRRFLLDEHFAYDPRTNVGLGLGASTGGSAAEIDALLDEAVRAKAQFILRVTVPLADAGNTRVIDAFKTYLFDAIRRAHGSLSAIAISPDLPADTAWTDAQRAAFCAFYLAGYETTKRADKTVLMLGTGSADNTIDLLVQRDNRLLAYLDAFGVTDAAAEPQLAAPLLAARKMPLYMLPPRTGKMPPPAAALARHAAVVPIPAPGDDNGVTAHLLNGTVFVQRVSIAVPTADPAAPDSSNIPYIAVFQGDGYAVAAVAGFAAGTELDAQYPQLARTPTQVEPQKPDEKPYPNLEIGDDTRSMRVVDAAGAPVDCRIGDHLYVPAQDAFVYVLQAGSAQDLAGTLAPSTANRLPILEITATPRPGSLTLHLTNISTRPQAGTLRLLRPPTAGTAAPAVIAEREFAAVSANKSADLAIATEHLLSGTIVVEVTTSGAKPVIQRTAVTLP